MKKKQYSTIAHIIKILAFVIMGIGVIASLCYMIFASEELAGLAFIGGIGGIIYSGIMGLFVLGTSVMIENGSKSAALLEEIAKKLNK